MTHTECSGEIVPMSNQLVLTTLNSYLLLFVITMSFVWIVLYSFNFSFLRKTCRKSSASVLVNECETKGPDTGRCFAVSFVISLIFIALVWAFKKW